MSPKPLTSHNTARPLPSPTRVTVRRPATPSKTPRLVSTNEAGKRGFHVPPGGPPPAPEPTK